MRRLELPPSVGEVFAVVEARRAGVTASRVRAADLSRPFRGVRRLTSGAKPESPEAAVLAAARAFGACLTGHQFYSHVTSAVIWGFWLPAALVRPDVLDTAVFSPRRNPRGAGIRGHEIAPSLATRTIHASSGLPTASPASTWAMLGAVLSHPYDLIAAGDAAVRTPQHPADPPPLTSIAQLAAASGAGRRVGIGALREALARVRTGSSSRPETWTRLTLADAGLPEPELAWPVYDRDGIFIGRVDLAYPRWKIAIEYEGAQHLLDAGQWRRDIERYERLTAEGWLVIRVTKEELFTTPASLVARVRRAIARATR
ncbi:endonuclease domain-containing protein [Microbacterium sp. P04]|uniref:endonuclease domain-containing protein n=1 Tax=Microbacterium sp. P04 TaxID=3366947 RepID=UPI003745C654